MPHKLTKTAERDVIIESPRMSISRKNWLKGIENARDEAIERKVRFIVPDENIYEDYRENIIGRHGKPKCVQCQFPWHEGECECGQVGPEEEYRAKYWYKKNL